jgi:hypothetical protein
MRKKHKKRARRNRVKGQPFVTRKWGNSKERMPVSARRRA